MDIKEVGEFGIIDRIRSHTQRDSKNIILGIGDDCAAYLPSKGKLQIVTTDSMVEGVHFRHEYFTPQGLGEKALSINLSDIASMGGEPKIALISMELPTSYSVDWVDLFYKGLVTTADQYQVNIIGGNISGTTSKFSVHITLIGEVDRQEMITRKNATPGDYIFVTGTLGDSAAGLEYLKNNKTHDFKNRYLINKHLSPIPRLETGQIISKNFLATSMIDVSDGVVSDLRKICNDNKLGAILSGESIPVSEPLKDYSAIEKKDPLKYALYGGEDYELLFTVSAEKKNSLEKLLQGHTTLVTCIGQITDDHFFLIADEKGEKEPLKDIGFDHFFI